MDYAPGVKKILRENGCEFVRQAKGSHEIWFSPLSGVNFTVCQKIKSRHTANKSLRDAGLEKAF